MIIAAYCRVSTDSNEQLESLANQKAFFAEYARRSGHRLFRVYVDEGISGTSLKKRDEFLRLLHDAEQGLFEMVVVKDVSRFSRNTVDALQSVRHLKHMGIHTLFLTANMDTMGDSEFVLTLFSALAQEESNNLSKRVKFGKRINAEKGRVPPRVFGYDRVDNFTLAINDEEAAVVRKIFHLYCTQGLGCRSISTALNQAGDKTKFAGAWNPRGVRRVLGNPLYCGTLINHKYEIEDFLTGRQVPVPSAERFFHQRPDWAIIPREMFQEAQKIMESRRQLCSPGEPFRQGRYSGKHLFSTLIKCEHCGRSFCRKSYTYANTRVYWHCVTNDQYTAQRCSNRISLDEPELIQQLRRYFSTVIPDQETFIDDTLDRMEKKLPKACSPDAVRQEWEKRRKKLTAKKERYQELYANGLLSMAELKPKLALIQKELEAIDTPPAITAPPKENPGDSLGSDREKIRRFLNMETMTNAHLRRVLDHISVNQEGIVKIVMKKLTFPPLPPNAQ